MEKCYVCGCPLKLLYEYYDISILSEDRFLCNECYELGKFEAEVAI